MSKIISDLNPRAKHFYPHGCRTKEEFLLHQGLKLCRETLLESRKYTPLVIGVSLANKNPYTFRIKLYDPEMRPIPDFFKQKIREITKSSHEPSVVLAVYEDSTRFIYV